VPTDALLRLQAVAWVAGFIEGNFVTTFHGWLIGTVIAVVLCVPDWPIYNRHPVAWLSSVPPSGSSKLGKKGSADAKAEKPKKTKVAGEKVKAAPKKEKKTL
jgi:signal peptidase complex subunit 1